MFACSDPKNYMVVELCEDILIDEVSLANYEFFSSQFKDIKLSASDRYPAEESKWFTLGSFVTNNTRQDQVFSIASPRVWARYLKVEFLSHWDQEYYCPLTAIRVHGTTMIDKFKQDDELALQEKSRAEETSYGEECLNDVRICPADQRDDQDSLLQGNTFEDICIIPDQPHPNSLLLCSAPDPIKMLALPNVSNQCCLRPSSNISSNGTLPSGGVVKESMYEVIGKRLAMVETELKSHNEQWEQHVESYDGFFKALAEGIGKDFERLTKENNRLQETIDEFSKDLSSQRITLYLQTTILIVLIFYLLSPRLDDRSFYRPKPPRTAFTVDKVDGAASSDEYSGDEVDISSGPEDTYTDLDPHTPSFTPSRPGTPASSYNDSDAELLKASTM